MSAKLSFFAELKRRNVLRAGALYAAGAWLLVQVVTQVLPLFDVPSWSLRWIVIACAIGFPFWLAFAWFYEFTPSGLKRESEIAPGDSIAHSTGRKLDYWIIGILAVAVVLLVTNQFVLRRDATSVANTRDAKALAATLAKIPQKSVAVMPFANESGDPKQQYFSDGLSEELISDLTQINGLKVIGKYSSFKFRDSKDSTAQIGATLGVAHLIQGAVRQQGDRIRVTVGMIRAADGASVWSHSYDQPLKDLFSIQTQIGQAVVAALKIKLLGQTLGVDDKPPSGNVEAYKLMLQGRTIARSSTQAGYRQGIALYQQALKLDPDYAYAWGTLFNAWANLGILYSTGDARKQAYAQARIALDKQMTLAPDAAATHMDRGYLLLHIDNDPMGALAEFKRAYALAPNNGSAIGFMAGGFAGSGQLQQAVELYRKAIATDPLRMEFYTNLAYVLLSQGQLDAAEQATRNALALQPDYPGLYGILATVDMARGHLDAAEQAARKALALQPDFPGLYSVLAQIDLLRDDAAAALRNANRETNPDSKAWALVAVAQVAPDRKKADAALQDYLAKYGKDQPYGVADLYALRKQPDTMFEWLQRARKQHDPSLIDNLLNDPLVLAYQHDPRFAALCKEAGLPLPGQPLPATAGSASAMPPATHDVSATKP
jgi:TolB-like protein/tetratricopeptide (TPR) repeat protein